MRYPISSQDVMKGDLVYKTRESKKTFKYDGYCRLEKKYFASDYDDWNGNGAYFKKDKIVFVEYDGLYEKKGILKCAEYSDKPLNY